MRILMILSRNPSPVGNGGNHRSYQIVYDLQSVNPDAEKIILHEEEINKRKENTKHKKYLFEISDRLKLLFQIIRLRGCRFHLFTSLFKHYSSQSFNFSFDEQAYLRIVKNNLPIDICIIDHTKYSSVVNINSGLKIPTCAIPHNLETFDEFALLDNRKDKTKSFLMSFYQELETLSSCQNRLMISQTEVWFLDGLDLPAIYYPYIPVGEIRKNLIEVRQNREKQIIKPSLFLIIGSFKHTTTGKSLKWFFDNALENGLPPGCRIVVVGKGTEELRELYKEIPKVDFQGWVNTEKLLELMSTAKALLVPQLTGFGAITRIPEAACAAIPLIVSDHAANSFDVPPGIISLPNKWEGWYDAINSAMISSQVVSPGWNSYLSWEENQAKPLERLSRKYDSVK